jgi:hypothetical protein
VDISVFKGREAKLNKAIFLILAKESPLNIRQIYKKVRAQKNLEGSRYRVINRRIKALEEEDYLKQVARAKVEVDKLTPMFGPIASAVSPGQYRDQKFITAMNAALKEWKVGRKEVVVSRGARLSVPHYVRYKEEPFVTRIKKSARGRKILVIADFSGSMKSQEDEYKKAIVSSMEILDGVGSKTALFGFGGEKGGSNMFFFKLKRFEEPKWKPAHSARTAALEASYPSTPTGRTYSALEAYIKKHRPDVTLTITDGSPDNPVETGRAVKRIKRDTRMVAFGIGGSGMERRLKEFGYHDTFAVESVDRIPRRLVSLIAPTR